MFHKCSLLDNQNKLAKMSQIQLLKGKTLTTLTAACTPSSFQSEVVTLKLLFRKNLPNLESHSRLIVLVDLKNCSDDVKGKTSIVSKQY